MPDAGRAVMGFQDFTVKVTLRAFVTVLVFSIVLMVLGLPFIAACLAGLNIVTFLIYGWDKYASRRYMTRIPEITLLSLGAAGGTAGALLGQELFRHKTKSKAFRLRFFAITVAQITVLLLFCWLWL